MTEAKRRDLRVITELVINHTSDQHPWFKRAKRSAPGSSARNWYVWSDTDQKYHGTRVIFTDTEKSNWTWDDEAKAYYWHRFFAHQPDLNFENPRVVKAMVQVMKRWLDAGVDGFRLDAVPYLCEREGTDNENLPETHDVIKALRRELDAYAGGKVLLAEANQWPEDVQQYFGDGDECHLAYHFPLMPRIYMAIAQEDRFPITDIIRQTPDIPANCQWAMFLRNHDELTLEMVTDAERDYLWSTYAADPRARLNLGIRRRLAPLMDNDRRKIELMNSILMSMPGTPIIYYGDEIGMGDNIYLGDRNGVRTPMQWTPDRNGGFSRTDPAKLYLPPIMDPVYGYAAVNIEAQSRSLASLLSWMKRIIGVRKSSQVFGRGTLTLVRPANRTVLAYVRQLGEEAILCVANLSRAAQAVELDLSSWKGRIPQEMLGRARFPRIGELPYLVTLPPYGFYWFHLHSEPQEWQEPVLPHEVTTLVLGDDWETLVSGRNLRALETEVLPSFLAERRWFGDKGTRRLAVKLAAAVPLEHHNDRFLVAIVSASTEHDSGRYLLPLTIRWNRYTDLESKVLAAVRRRAREGSLLDAALEPEFIAALIAKLGASETIGHDARRLEFLPTSAFDHVSTIEHIRPVGVEQSNTSMIADNKYVIKMLRKVAPGTHPEVEIGRFLVEQAPFANAPALLGSVELVENGERSTLAVVHQFVENQGDGWTVIGQALDRLIDEQHLLPIEAISETPESAAMLNRLRQMGQRTAEFHSTMASRPDLPVFAPEPITAEDVGRWIESILQRVKNAFDLLDRNRGALSEPSRSLAAELADNRAKIVAHIEENHGSRPDVVKIRHHGDFHLGQILVASNDALIIDFEGEPRRTLVERRQKVPAARDVAGFCRSIDYATSAALERVTDIPPEERLRLLAPLRLWAQHLTETYWTAYREHIAQPQLWPKNEGDSRRLLDLFLLEKAFYEIGYELTNRPNWAGIPLEATCRILRQRGVIIS
jgi:maltose alpha-D-glucosyltransferase/alpha-amylase